MSQGGRLVKSVPLFKKEEGSTTVVTVRVTIVHEPKTRPRSYRPPVIPMVLSSLSRSGGGGSTRRCPVRLVGEGPLPGPDPLRGGPDDPK